jgi:hypothetical protein
MTDHEFTKLFKRMAHILVLEILKNHTDADHGLKVTQVLELLEEDYGVTMERKAVSRILNDLYALTEIPEEYSWKNPMPYSIKYTPRPRSSSEIRENWHLCKKFDDVEVQVLMDLVPTVKGYPAVGLLDKLQQLGSVSMQKSKKASLQAGNGVPLGGSMRYSMDVIMRAIREEKKLAFNYKDCADRFEVSPFKMTLRDGVYYLVCFDEVKTEMAVFEVEYISKTEVLNETAKDYHMVKDASSWQYNLDQYLDSYLRNT